MSYSAAHWRRVSDETRQMVAEVPLYRNRPEPPADPATVDRWLSQIPAVGKRELRKGFPKALLRQDQDLHSAMQDEKVTLLATSGTTADRLQVIWESELIPHAQIVMRRSYDAALQARVQAFLAAYGRKSGPRGEQERAQLKALHDLAGFLPADNGSLMPAAKLAYQLARQSAVNPAARRLIIDDSLFSL